MKNRGKGKHSQEVVQQKYIIEADSDKKITLLLSEICMSTLGLFYYSDNYEHTETKHGYGYLQLKKRVIL